MGKIMKYFLILLVLFSMPVSAEVYKWTDDSGRIHYSDKGRTNKAVESIEVKVNSYKHLANELVPGRDASDKKESKKVIIVLKNSFLVITYIISIFSLILLI